MALTASNPRSRRTRLAAVAGAALLVVGACSSGSTPSNSPGAAASAAAAGSGGKIGITLITKDPTNHYWTVMISGVDQAAAQAGNIQLTIAAGKDQTDTESQIAAIEDAVSRGDKAILIANNGPATNNAVTQAEKAGLLVIALDTPFTPVTIADGTFATDNFESYKLDGEWAAGMLAGKHAEIAMLDLFANKIVGIDLQRDQGFLAGMGIKVPNPKVNGSEAKTGNYTGGAGGTYTIACHGTTEGAQDGGRSAMEQCLAADPNINLVMAANETSADGAALALKAAGNNATIVTGDGSCAGVASVANGTFGAEAGQYPFQMGVLGVQAVVKWVKTGQKPQNSPGQDFYNTGTKLTTDHPVAGVSSVTTQQAQSTCW